MPRPVLTLLALGSLADGPTVSAKTIESYIAGVVDLYKQQQADLVNSHPHPRDAPTLRAVVRLAKNDERERKRKANLDRGIGASCSLAFRALSTARSTHADAPVSRAGTLQDGYLTLADFSKILAAAMHRNSPEGLRDRLGMCLGHYGLMRSSNILDLEFADLSSIQLEGEGPTNCFAVVAPLQHGKTNKDGRTEYGAFIRSREPEACGVGALGFHFFYQSVLSSSPSLCCARFADCTYTSLQVPLRQPHVPGLGQLVPLVRAQLRLVQPRPPPPEGAVRPLGAPQVSGLHDERAQRGQRRRPQDDRRDARLPRQRRSDRPTPRRRPRRHHRRRSLG